MPRGGYRPGAGRPKGSCKRAIPKGLTDEDLLKRTIIEIESDKSLRPKLRDMLIQYKLDQYKVNITKEQLSKIQKEFDLIYEFIRKFGLEPEFQRFVMENCPLLLQTQDEK